MNHCFCRVINLNWIESRINTFSLLNNTEFLNKIEIKLTLKTDKQSCNEFKTRID